MAKYLNRKLVDFAFKKLVSIRPEGKTHLERSSALLYFLSFDAACRDLEVDVLDLHPDSLLGKNNRQQVELEFSKLVLVQSGADGIRQVYRLGEIETGGTQPGKRISSNFFTVPLKKASEQKQQYFYPKRPKAPLLKMGLSSTGLKWGIKHHDDWRSNFPKILSDIPGSISHINLSIFLLRDERIDDKITGLKEALCDGLRKRFTEDVSSYVIGKINKEMIFFKYSEEPFSDYYSQYGNIQNTESYLTVLNYENMKKNELIERVLYFEELLKKNNIRY